MSPPLPARPNGFRLIGATLPSFAQSAPLGSIYRDDGAAYAVALGPEQAHDVASLAAALPEPDSLEPGALVIVLARVVEAPTLARRVFFALGRGHTISRALRCSALLCRGYVRIGAGTDPETRADLAWGYVPLSI
ncbi:MAG: hypothetical protein FWD69_01085 [Polyangiaceae bacterium]|nr:hypothetical protein [Polyangiaceae bacterium]